MAVDSLRETRHINRISTQDLGVVWSAQSYRADVTAALRKIRSMTWRPLAQLCSNVIGPGPHPTFTSTGHPCLKTRNVLGVVVDASEVDFVEHSDTARWPHYCIEREDLVLNVTGAGSIGRVGMYFGSDLPLTNQHLARVSIGPGADAAFVCAFLSSWWGERALEQGISGSTGQLNLVNEHVRQVPVPTPDIAAQRYIGDKVRQADRLRERARRLEKDVAAIHAKHIVLPIGIDFAKRTRRLPFRSLTERLDAHFYPSAVEQYFRQLGGSIRSLDDLSTVVINGQSQPESEEGVLQATVANLGRSFVEGALRTVKRPTDGARALALHDLLLCNAAHNKSYIGRDVTYSQLEGPYPSTEVMVVRVDREQVPASFIRQYLKTQIGYLQIQSTIRGITAHSYPGDVKSIEIPIPSVPDTERGAWFATDDTMLIAGRCADAAKVLTIIATVLVEQLIEGRLTEADLVAAQKALEMGDRSADRTILQSLRRNDGPDATPVIPDLDGLYALLDEPDGEKDR
ncbi:restriction endonuclease subunit S [Burkholderia sp. BCC1638]|uniref:restriction endonuclease subunit S n=1 Tax=Burkholderia sp. BCC1638 TaxID=2681391 RepID=UPI001589D957|nr:restriction endonuclease subunit S [Burkholderia sp. BCC1638]